MALYCSITEPRGLSSGSAAHALHTEAWDLNPPVLRKSLALTGNLEAFFFLVHLITDLHVFINISFSWEVLKAPPCLIYLTLYVYWLPLGLLSWFFPGDL